jgi:hypothetical protein
MFPVVSLGVFQHACQKAISIKHIFRAPLEKMWLQQVYNHKKSAYDMFALSFREMRIARTCPEQPLTIKANRYGTVFPIPHVHRESPPVFLPVDICNLSFHIKLKTLENGPFPGISIHAAWRKGL